jgi:AcrR family transcriptional regulator
MPPPPASEIPLNRNRILDAAESVIRQFGPAKATVVDVARALGVSHAAVYRHVASKTELRELVVGRWIEQSMAPLRKAVAAPGPAPRRLRRFIEALIANKRTKVAADPQLFTAYRTLAADAQAVITAHLDDLIQLAAALISAGIAEGSFRRVDPIPTARAILVATSRFHHPAHAADWSDPAIDADFESVWGLLMTGLLAAKRRE